MTIGVIDGAPSSRRHAGARRAVARFDLSLSENPFPPLPSVLHAVNVEMARSNRYPEFLPHRLPALVAARLGIDADQVVVGAGATGVAMQIIQALTTHGDELVTSTPTFDGYPIMADMAGLRLVPVPLDSSGAQDLSAMRRAVTKRTKLVVVCRPHNPTGTVVTSGELRGFLSAVPNGVPVVLDEAYVEFLADPDQLDTTALLRKHSNLIVLRTFSKAYGLAGLRIGYAFGGRELMARIRRLQLPFGMGTAAVAAVAASYAAATELGERVRRITTARELLRDTLLADGLSVPRSHANFLYLPGPGIATALRRAGITAKCYPDGSARIAVGDPAADHAVLTALRARPTR
ncbi:aminotransferase class I/II-fold pyridoxal phosphate-dependent enzyme [Nocardia bovistercoris]|uniref:Aminotransferase class I/II-fold pyridoxal phosphate-dependent enzyme n=1 Tax=Nocardia bovistercoris TaxID=2785916 RepID=A0A931IDS5_9NOCA|nr:aminotransferase class I/II-fold pyridoxal phosphate-dependent enzyme [Nocardia bovistercoris]MBH0778663.1 aminotransferase class I/II-fold pyridoxal phosphate-dependent enzyme [Nocardia bovistercoris]